MYGIITFDDTTNYGTVLQLYGLVRVLRREFGISACALGYEENRDFVRTSDKEAWSDDEDHRGGISLNRPEEWLWRGDRFLFTQRKRSLLRRFIRDHQLRGRGIADYADIEGVIIGSDEVFTLQTGMTPARWGFGLPTDHVSAYAASFGSTTLEQIRARRCEVMVRAGLGSMEQISVRDSHSAAIVEALTGQAPGRCLDPVLLDGFAAEQTLTPPDEARPYLLVYGYDYAREDPEVVSRIEEYANAEGLEIISVGAYHPWAQRNLLLTPAQLIGYFAHATGVVTQTFHGTVLSLLTGTPMEVFPTDFNRQKVTGLLEDFGLLDCIASGDLSLFATRPDYSGVQQQLDDQRQISLDYLREVVAR